SNRPEKRKNSDIPLPGPGMRKCCSRRSSCGAAEKSIIQTRKLSHKTSERIAPPSRSQQLVGCDRQVANSFAGRVIDSIGDRGRRPDDADLADPSRAHGIRVRIMLVEPNSVEFAYVGMGGDVVARKVVIDDVTEPRIE